MSFLVFFIALSLMVFVHELGHFLAAKKKGVKVTEFGFGFPPRLFAKKVRETTYSINALPMGGFVQIWGMDKKVRKEKHRAFYEQKPKTQFFILSAGVLMNFFISVIVFSVFYGINGVPKKRGNIEILEVAQNSPAEIAGLTKGMIIEKIETDEVTVKTKTAKIFTKTVKKNAGKQLTFVNNEGKMYFAIPRVNPPENEGALGVVFTDSIIIKPNLFIRIPLGVANGVKEGAYWGLNILEGLFAMIKDIFRGKAPKDIAGPVGIYKVSEEIMKTSGLAAVIHFFAVVSINLVIVNILPIPGTDGWHASLVAFEKIRRKKIKEKTKRKLNQIGITILIGLFLLILAADIKRYLIK